MLAAAPDTERKSFGNGRKGRKELVELAPDILALAWREPGDQLLRRVFHGAQHSIRRMPSPASIPSRYGSQVQASGRSSWVLARRRRPRPTTACAAHFSRRPTWSPAVSDASRQTDPGWDYEIETATVAVRPDRTDLAFAAGAKSNQ